MKNGWCYELTNQNRQDSLIENLTSPGQEWSSQETCCYFNTPGWLWDKAWKIMSTKASLRRNLMGTCEHSRRWSPKQSIGGRHTKSEEIWKRGTPSHKRRPTTNSGPWIARLKEDWGMALSQPLVPDGWESAMRRTWFLTLAEVWQLSTIACKSHSVAPGIKVADDHSSNKATAWPSYGKVRSWKYGERSWGACKQMLRAQKCCWSRIRQAQT